MSRFPKQNIIGKHVNVYVFNFVMELVSRDINHPQSNIEELDSSYEMFKYFPLNQKELMSSQNKWP